MPPRRTDIDALLGQLPPDEAARLRTVWDLVGSAEPLQDPAADEVEGALATVLASDRSSANGLPLLDPPRPGPVQQDRAPRPHIASTPAAGRGWGARRRGGLLASVVVLVVLAAAFVAWYVRPITRLVAPGERLAIELPDGSRVELNSGSSLRYARGFGDVRRVHLEGEAFFEVTEAEAPFVVETFNAEVRVLGTRFGVRAWPEGLEEATTVALASGRVRLAPRAEPDRAVEMAPGETQRVVWVREGARIDRPGAATVDDAVAWRRGDLVFKDRMLGVVLADVERRFGVEVRLAPERLARTRLNLALRRPESAEAVVRDLAMALGLAYRETATGFELFEDPATRLLPDAQDGRLQ